MATPVIPPPNPIVVSLQPWQPSTQYPTGSIVIPSHSISAGATPPTNADFEVGGLANWTSSGSWAASAVKFYTGANSASLPAGAGTKTLINQYQAPCLPGQVINASLYFFSPDMSSNTYTAALTMTWYNASFAVISTSTFNQIGRPPLGAVTGWTLITSGPGGSCVAPALTAFVSIGCSATNTGASPMYVDTFQWDYVATAGVNLLAFTATQPNSVANPISGTQEPKWPTTAALTVTDNNITWTAGVQSTITWQASKINVSNVTEPTWPLSPNVVVLDGSINWQCNTPQILDANCPQSKYVLLLSSKIYAGDNDIVRYSATTNPMDWTAKADAGFLPTGLQNYGANPVTGMGPYRSNLVVFNSQGSQMWQVDEDPANMSLLTTLPIGCSYPKTICPVNNDLFFLAAQGVRTMGISGASSNLEAGDVGMPIDTLVQAGVAYCNANGKEPLAAYYPSAGQFWIHFPGWQASGYFFNTPVSTSNVFVCTMNRRGDVLGAWSRYNFPFPTIDALTMAGDVLYLRSGDDVLAVNPNQIAVDPGAVYDYFGDTYLGGNRQASFTWCLEWPYIDFGQPGTSKFLGGIDVIGKQTTNVTVSIGYNQTDHTVTGFTTPFAMPGDSLPGMGVPMALEAPSFAPRLTGVSTDQWEIEAVILYVDDAAPGV